MESDGDGPDSSPDKTDMIEKKKDNEALAIISTNTVSDKGDIDTIIPTKVDDKGSNTMNEESKGTNVVIDDPHRNTAIELFENYFARAYRRKNNAPMSKMRFMKRIENAKKREIFDDDYVKKFE